MGGLPAHPHRRKILRKLVIHFYLFVNVVSLCLKCIMTELQAYIIDNSVNPDVGIHKMLHLSLLKKNKAF